jgi:hypothetical protein
MIYHQKIEEGLRPPIDLEGDCLLSKLSSDPDFMPTIRAFLYRSTVSQLQCALADCKRL